MLLFAAKAALAIKRGGILPFHAGRERKPRLASKVFNMDFLPQKLHGLWASGRQLQLLALVRAECRARAI